MPSPSFTGLRAVICVLLAAAAVCVFPLQAGADPFLRVRLTTPKEGKPRAMVGFHLRTGPGLTPTWRWRDDRGLAAVGGPSLDQFWRDTAEADGWIERDDAPPLKPGERRPGRGEFTMNWPLKETEFTPWIDLAKLNLPAANAARAGGKAEWPMVWVYVDGPRDGVSVEVQLAEKSDAAEPIVSFVERTSFGTVGFTLPSPLAANKAEVESGSQMSERQGEWVKELARNKAPNPGRFDLWVSLAGLYYDPGLIVPAVETVRRMGFNVITGVPVPSAQEVALRMARNAEFYQPDVEAALNAWKEAARGPIASEFNTPEGAWVREHLAFYSIGGDGSSTFGLKNATGLRALAMASVSGDKVNAWYRDYLKSAGVTAETLGADPEKAAYKAFAPGGELAQRKSVYHSARFAQQLSASHLKSISEGIRGVVPGIRTVAVLSQAAMLGAKGDGSGAAAGNVDPFLAAGLNSVQLLGVTDQVSVQLGDTSNAFSGAGTHEFFYAVLRSACVNQDVRPIAQVGPGDEKMFYAKALGALGQGARSFHVRDFGPTFVAKNEYWSDLASMYDGVVRFNDMLEKNEELLYAAKTVTDPVAILWSASNDIWAGGDGSEFSDMRLTWHALRHMGYQPSFVSEAQVEAGALKNYKVLYSSARCTSKKAGETISAWVNEGGVAFFAGAAGTRDQFDEAAPIACLQPLLPQSIPNPARVPGRYSERADLPGLKPLGQVSFNDGKTTHAIPAIGYKSELFLPANGVKIAGFADGDPAVASLPVGKGQIIVSAVLPGLAYGQGAGFKPGAMDEKWPDGPRLLIKIAVDAAKLPPVARIEPDGSGTSVALLNSAGGATLLVLNPSGRNIAKFRVDIRASIRPVMCMSHDGARVTIRRGEGNAYAVELPLRGLSEVIPLPK